MATALAAAAATWAVRLGAYLALGAYLVSFGVRAGRPHPEPVAAALSESAGRFLAFCAVAALAHADLGASLLLACCVLTACAEVDELTAAA